MADDRAIIKQLEEELGEIPEDDVVYEGENVVEIYLASFQEKTVKTQWTIEENKQEIEIALPDIIGELTNLKILNLDESDFVTLPESIGKLTNLIKLSAFDAKKLKSVPDSIVELINLEELKLQHTQITTLPEGFGNLKKLRRAILNSNKLKTLPNNFGELENLVSLSINNNELTSLPETFGKLKNLKEININKNQLTSLPESFGELESLQRLELENNPLTSLPESFGNLQNLTHLVINRNKLSSLPDSFGKLENLKRLNLEENQLTSLPETIGDLKALENLTLLENNLTALPESFKNLDKLNVLNINGNNIDPIPPFLAELKSLRNLGYKDRDLDFYLANMDIIRKLSANKVSLDLPVLFWFYFADIPEPQIKIITQMETDVIGPTLVRELTRKEGFWVQIDYELNIIVGISAPKAYIKELPENFGELKDLKYLILNNNNITSLPSSIGNCINLEEVDLSNNKLTEIPTELWAFNKLTELNLSNNPFNSEDMIISQKVPDLIREHLRKKATIKIFISHAVVDFEPYRIGDLVDYLEKQKEISQVFFCEEDLAGNIDEWMLDAVQKCQLILFIGTNKSVFNSVDCANELQLADKFSIPVIPLKGKDVDWPDLAERNLSRELGLEYNTENFDAFCEDIYKYIENFKREINLMDGEERQKGIMNIYERFRLILNETVNDQKREIEDLKREIEAIKKQIQK